MGQLKFMFIQEPGNLQAIEFVPGEMLAMKMRTEDMEQVKGWSTWKEGLQPTSLASTLHRWCNS